MWLFVQWVILTALSVALLTAVYRLVTNRDSRQGDTDELNLLEGQNSDRDHLGPENMEKRESGESSI